LRSATGRTSRWSCTACSTSSTRQCCCRNGRAKTAAPAWCSSPATYRRRRSKGH
jgi:hypothetical protein